MKIIITSYPVHGIDHEVIWAPIAILAIFASRFFPFERFHYICPFHALTGHPCPTCGMTRSFIFMSKGNFKDAFFINPLGAFLFIFAVLYVIYAAYVIIFKKGRIRIKVSKREAKIIRCLAVAIILLNWIYLLLTF
ncbi:MAG: hypothetical protein DRG20_05945 [Deltaproteobacteria bacterium]|nr:DUF2752 domain-containing protein [Deltaproteobacteria bacterium]RLA88554.1 MAG: hypothetical protein DRG20_05945 [Deltaproteobacteria bacterium]